MVGFPRRPFLFLSRVRKIYRALLGYEHTAYAHVYIYIPRMGMHGNTKFSIHLPTEGLLRSPTNSDYSSSPPNWTVPQ